MRQGTRVGLVGCGKWGRHVLRDLVSLGCEVSVTARSEASRAAAAEGGAADVTETVGELPEVEGIVVVTPTKTHAAVVEEALAREVPVFVEKPLTDDLAAADRLAAAAPERLFVMDKWRYHPAVELLAELARTQELGRVLGLRTTRNGWGNPHDVDSVWILAPHELAIGLEILGTLPATRSAVAAVQDGYAFGLVAVLGEDPWHALELSSRAPERRREITLVCEDGIAVVQGGHGDGVRIFRVADPSDTTVPEPELRPVSSELPLLRELQAFVEHLAGGPPPRSSAAEGAAAVRRIAELRALAGIAP